MNKPQWNLNPDMKFIFQDDIFDNIICNTATILSGRRYVNSSSPGQNGRHFAEDIFKRIFLNEKVWFLATF